MKVKLINGKEIIGKFAENSYAPIFNDCNDIYLEEIYNKRNRKIPNSKGVYIAKDQIQQIIILEDIDNVSI